MGTKSVLAIITLGAAGAAVGLPYYNGMQAEQHFDTLLTRYTTPGVIKLDRLEYQRSLFDASARSQMTLNHQKGTLILELNHKIQHGPTIDSTDAFTITTEATIPADQQYEFKHYFGDQAPLSVISRIAHDGSEATEILSPAFSGSALERPSVAIEWQGVNGTIHQDQQMKQTNADLKAPGLKVSDSEASMEMGEISMLANLNRVRDMVWIGESRIGMDHLKFDFTAPDKPDFRLDKLRIVSNQQAESEKLHTISVAFDADSLTVDDYQLTAPGYAIEIKHLDIDAYVELNRKITEIQAMGIEPEAAVQMMGLTLIGNLPTLLRSSPEISITRMGATTPEGRVNGNLRIAYTGDGNLHLDQPMALLMDLDGDVEFDMPKALVKKAMLQSSKQRIATAAAQQGQEIADDELEALALQGVESQLILFGQQQWIVEQGDSYRSRIEYRKGALTINGQAADILSMLMQPQQ
ncbi:hypothetical protein BOW53_04515 [Solemya pervernicosa gill symbiont]|uniref:DUF945 domain-containing protein n=1 Tax=Solemya pervernicosa gill symbiont TaxID=642797 RepID=A0A1T2L813_9GAMM|nr:YdgA family protein [Solemya pervernicosa gill symbiont]OOZ41248.1 hypothetical protein BOW53_04515 [Solemya pervernicosa gill symbiont]